MVATRSTFGRCLHGAALTALLMVQAGGTQGATLPQERADAMYHRYDGGGITVDGPSVLVRKNFRERVSLSANYYVDNVSSASIDVLASGASKYTEKRTEYSLAGQYLHDKSTVSAGYSNSDESDYTADTYFINISQDFFGDLTTLTLGYTLGQDDVGQNGNDAFSESIDRHNFRFGMTQVATPNLILGLDYELVTDEGYLNNPYRSYRYQVDPLDQSAGYQFAQEVYPDTRTSDAAAIRFMYYITGRHSLGGNYRYFTDDWGIDAHTATLSFTTTWRNHWIVEARYRYHQQAAADFYSDLFAFESQDENDWRARDKELSDFDNHTLSLYISYERDVAYALLDRAGVTLEWDHIWFEYENFTDLRVTDVPTGDEPAYSFEADVLKLVFTLWY